MITHAAVTTFSGSQYEFQLDESGWWARGNNIPNPQSVRLDGEWWPIKMPSPWPPQHGTGMMFLSSAYEERESPLRIPGGGKLTSPVVSVEILASE